MTRSPIYLVASCTARKRAAIPEELRLGSIAAPTLARRAELWSRRLARVPGVRRYPAAALYGGEHFTLVRRSLELLLRRSPAALWIASAGYGLVSGGASLAPYSATFTRGAADSVTRELAVGASLGQQQKAWWAELSGYPGPEPGAPRSLHELARRSPRATLLIVAAPPYIRAMRIDLLAACGALGSREQLIVVTNRALLADSELGPNVVPVDERWRTIVGGTMPGLNARVAHRLLAEGIADPCTAAGFRARVAVMVNDAARPVRPVRERTDDAQVQRFVRTALGQDPGAGWTALLRVLRRAGCACEQSRFRELHRQVRAAMHAAG